MAKRVSAQLGHGLVNSRCGCMETSRHQLGLLEGGTATDAYLRFRLHVFCCFALETLLAARRRNFEDRDWAVRPELARPTSAIK